MAKGGIAARAAPFGGHPRKVSQRLRGATSGLDRTRAGTLVRSIPTSVKAAVDAYVWARDNNCCTRCGKGTYDTTITVAHIIAHADGGPYTPNNLRLRCIDCHMNNEIGTSNRNGARLLRGIKRRRR